MIGSLNHRTGGVYDLYGNRRDLPRRFVSSNLIFVTSIIGAILYGESSPQARCMLMPNNLGFEAGRATLGGDYHKNA